MLRSTIHDQVPAWVKRIRPYPPGKPIEEVERELGHPAIKLASNENPLGPSPRAMDAIRGTLGRLHLYPDGNGYALREKLAAHVGLSMNQIILGAGSTDLIELAARTFLSAADEGITAESSFYIYRLAIEAMGAALIQVPLLHLTYDLPAIARCVTPRTKVIYLANPNNPTGTMFTADEFDRFLRDVPERVLVVLDEAYYDYIERPDYSRSLNYVRAGRNLLVLRTFSKVHGLAGLRIGFGMGPAELIGCLNQIRSPFNASSLAQAGAMAAMDDRDHVARSVELNRREMTFVTKELSLMGIRFTPSVANFVLIDTARDCEDDFIRLLDQGVIVRPMKLYGFPTSLRVTIGTRSENEQFLEAMRSITLAPARASA